ncbi:winged helix-turn-helix transcriptional regulator [Streptomyces radicis]|uniref:Transcriptional regulator n=1 Tax=Streptomyces radicis TaxID=1750517 RepID=A0A3A9VRW8_9ACTN|nr:helix-turn-helix domain-containing protein [Streptomyces radicis]RKN03821.1 transcriptional regulator [Streptomyces radicis]RKN13940.1 transcriptional regulator [Streptomyces radicis]
MDDARIRPRPGSPGAARGHATRDDRVGMDRLADQWSGLVILLLADGTRRYAELRSALREFAGGISEKMLTQTLRGMERDGLLTRRDHQTYPRRVEYTLTPLGLSLREPLLTVCDWSARHREDIRRARARYDASP